MKCHEEAGNAYASSRQKGVSVDNGREVLRRRRAVTLAQFIQTVEGVPSRRLPVASDGVRKPHVVDDAIPRLRCFSGREEGRVS